MNVSDKEITELLTKYKKITVIGLSRDSAKPAQKVPLYLHSKGYDVVGVHPTESEIAGFKCFKKLEDVPAEYTRFIDVFRPINEIPAVVDEILQLKNAEVLFLQLGIQHKEAEEKAQNSGLKVISNRCLHLEVEKILNSKK